MTNHPNRSKQQTAKHTPGPWHHKHDDYAKNVINVEADGHIPICRLTGIASARNDGEANARLIAAAPELLAALKAVTDDAEQAIKDIGGCDHSVGICCCDIIGNVEHARTAIAKAEGR